MNAFTPGQLAINTLGNGSTVTVRVIAYMPAPMNAYRVTDARETATDKQLIRRNRTWAAPAERLTLVAK